jgi:hypothetical protein
MDTKTDRGLSSDEARYVTKELKLLADDATIGRFWPAFEAALKDSQELLSDTWTPDQMLVAALDGGVQLWLLTSDDTPVCFMATQFYRTQNRAIFQIFWAYGMDLQPMFPLLSDAFDSFAAKHGAEKIEIQGRKGFERWLRPFGFELDYCTYSRRVKAPTEN